MDDHRGGRYSHISTDAFTHSGFTNDDDDLLDYHGGHGRGGPRWAAAAAGLYRASVKRYGQRKGPLLLALCCFAVVLSTFALHKRFVSADRAWPVVGRARTVAFSWADLRGVWEWEIRAGHYPSTNPIPVEIGFMIAPVNPALPASVHPDPKETAREGRYVRHTVGSGAGRIYLEVRNPVREFGHPPRPIAGSTLDLDRVHQHCAFERGKYVRDCLEYLRLGAGLDGSGRLRRDPLENLQHIYVLDGEGDHIMSRGLEEDATNQTAKLTRRGDRQNPCTDDDPRIFHMFWEGPFTDKPYMAMLSFLFTQNLGLHLDVPPSELQFCPPQLWVWISQNAMDDLSTSSAEEEMYEELQKNPWVSPFLHPRFKHAIQFRLWNTTEQLDSTRELKDHWRTVKLRSEGRPAPKGERRLGSLDGKSKNSYTKAPVVLSDIVRFVLCHRYGGVYLDVDMLFLRDWEELWGWSGSFSYRWSIRDRYNTAVLRLRSGSSLGSFILETALKHGLDFHPISFSFYLQDAKMDGLLNRVPDALFDPAWLTSDFLWLPWKTTYFQRDRPPTPPFTDFDQFFNTPQEMSGMPGAVGFDGFFRGAYLYHYHNGWWKPFDKARDWPDLGPRFADGERTARAAIADLQSKSYSVGIAENDQGDLDWSAVLKRTFEAYIRGERPNMYGEWIRW